MVQRMEHGNDNGSIYGTILSIMLLVISKITLSDVAAFGAILAGFTTAGYNIYKFINERKKDKNEKIP